MSDTENAVVDGDGAAQEDTEFLNQCDQAHLCLVDYKNYKAMDKSPKRDILMVVAWRKFKSFPEPVQKHVLLASERISGDPLRVGRRVELRSQMSEKQEQEAMFIKITICGSGYYGWRMNHDEEGPLLKKKYGSQQWFYQYDKWDEWYTSELNAGGWSRLEGTAIGWKRPADKGYEVMFAGPVGLKGGSDRAGGTNTIAALIEGATKQAQTLAKGHKGPLAFLVRAHSRGAVAATNVVNDLKTMFEDARVELVNFDPVPGPLTEYNVQVSSAKNKEEYDEKFKQGNLGTIDASTIIYSVNSQNQMWGVWDAFTPQQVMGADRVIVSQQSHSVVLTKGFRFEGRLYNGSGINSLDPGVYLDANPTGENTIPLKRVASLAEFQSQITALLDAAQKVNKKVTDTHRKEIIERAVDSAIEKYK